MILPEVNPTEPGRYVCLPAATRLHDDCKLMGISDPVNPEGVWIVDVLVEDWAGTKFLCYSNPKTGENHMIEDCGHTFYGPMEE